MTLIFDFNGTLLNDVDVCFNLLNELLSFRGHKNIDLKTYKSIFRFPIIEYYKAAGFVFPKDNYDELADIFIKKYKMHKLKLYDNVYDVLSFLKKKYKLVVLSSSEKTILESQLRELQIYDLFDEVIGNDDVCGKSKLQNGIDYRRRNEDEQIIVIGDTDHDLEVANEINANAILVSFGHQNRKEKGVKIINKFNELLDIL